MQSPVKFLIKHKKTALSILCVLNVFIIYVWYDSQGLTYLFDLELSKDTTCFYSDNEDALDAVDKDFSLPPWSIFFIETSCHGGLNSRQACSVESAARAHPLWQITVFFLAPVSEYTLNQSCLRTLKQFENVQLVRIHIVEFTENTPLAAMLSKRLLQSSLYPIENFSNGLRYLILYRWGGIYLDMDIIVAKNLKPLGANWVGKESDIKVNTAVMALARDLTGSHLAADLITEFKEHFVPSRWGLNGPKLLTRILAKKWCSPKRMKYWRVDNCNGIQIYDASLIYPIHYESRHLMFKEGDSDILKYTDAYTYHTWNRLTRSLRIPKNSAYDQLAKKFCPSIYNLFGNKFGV